MGQLKLKWGAGKSGLVLIENQKISDFLLIEKYVTNSNKFGPKIMEIM
jgi:hypothetical protein